MFEKLPETFPRRDAIKKPALLSSAAFHLLILALIIVIPVAITPEFAPIQTLSPVYLLSPPPPALVTKSSPPDTVSTGRKESLKQVVSRQKSNPVRVPRTDKPVHQQSDLIAPTKIPRDIARLSDVDFGAVAVIGGIPGGGPGGTTHDLLGGVIGGATEGRLVVSSPPLPLPLPLLVAFETLVDHRSKSRQTVISNKVKNVRPRRIKQSSYL